MAIHCLNPNTIASEASAVHDYIDTTGRKLIDSFSGTIESLKGNWKGSDAVANLNNLAAAYTVVTDFLKTLQNTIVITNNGPILDLQREIVSSGGDCSVGGELSVTLMMDSSVNVPQDAVEARTEAGIVADAEGFNSFPEDLDTFVDSLYQLTDILLKNWLEGAGHETVSAKFEEFKKDFEDLLPKIKQVRDNLNTVAENKKALM